MYIALSFLSGAVSIVALISLVVVGMVALDWFMNAVIAPMIYQPRLLPIRVRTAEEQRVWDECHRTMRPGEVHYTFTVKPDHK